MRLYINMACYICAAISLAGADANGEGRSDTTKSQAPGVSDPDRLVCCLLSVVCQVGEGYKNVAALLDHLNVDASNPLAVLTQVRAGQRGAGGGGGGGALCGIEDTEGGKGGLGVDAANRLAVLDRV
jgi:hypothetical protein